MARCGVCGRTYCICPRRPRPTVLRPEDPGDGRVWVWMGGLIPPRWELRGTGLTLDPKGLRSVDDG